MVENSPSFPASCPPKPRIDYSELASCKTPTPSADGKSNGKLVVGTVVVITVVVLLVVAVIKIKQGKTKQAAKFKQYVDQVEAGRVQDEAVQNDAFRETGGNEAEATSGYLEVAGASTSTEHSMEHPYEGDSMGVSLISTDKE